VGFGEKPGLIVCNRDSRDRKESIDAFDAFDAFVSKMEMERVLLRKGQKAKVGEACRCRCCRLWLGQGLVKKTSREAATDSPPWAFKRVSLAKSMVLNGVLALNKEGGDFSATKLKQPCLIGMQPANHGPPSATSPARSSRVLQADGDGDGLSSLECALRLW
jgi:hypothetical protein